MQGKTMWERKGGVGGWDLSSGFRQEFGWLRSLGDPEIVDSPGSSAS